MGVMRDGLVANLSPWLAIVGAFALSYLSCRMVSVPPPAPPSPSIADSAVIAAHDGARVR
jgi:hypothetical protein